MKNTDERLKQLYNEAGFWICVEINSRSYMRSTSSLSHKEIETNGILALTEGASKDLLKRAFDFLSYARPLREKYGLDVGTFNRFVESTTRATLFN